MSQSGRRVLVTGGAGFIGSHIGQQLVDDGATVLAVDNLSTGRRENVPTGAKLAQVDIGSPQFVDVARDFRPHAITHCAAQAAVAVSMAQPMLDATINIVGGINVCQAAEAAGCEQVVYITTGGALYGEADYLPCDEDHPVRPISAYGLSKHTLERYLHLLLPDAIPLKVLRLANVYGPRQDPHGEAAVVAVFGARMLLDQPVAIFGDGEQTRDFVYVGDVVRAHQLALDNPGPFTVNISSATGVSVNALFRQLAELTGYHRPPQHTPERKGDIRDSVLDNRRARRVLGWTPGVSLPQGLQLTVESIRRGNT